MGFLCLDTRSFLKLLRFYWNCGNFCTLLMLTCIYILTQIWHQDRLLLWKIPAQKALFWLYISHKIILWKKLTWSAWHNHWGTIFIPKHLRNRLSNEKEEDTLQKKNYSYCSLQYFSSMSGLAQTQSPCAILNVHVWECVKIQWLSKIRPLTVCVGTFTHRHAQKCRCLLECTCVTYRPAKMNHRHQKCSCIWP